MILVTGATGNVGRRAVRQLLDQGQRVSAVSRDPKPGAVPEGAEPVGADPSHPQSLRAALDGVEAILLSPRAVGGAAEELLSLARQHGVKRVTVLSAVTVQYPVGHRRFIEEFAAVEGAAKGSGLDWTILRCADFASNTLAWSEQIRGRGTVFGAYPQAATSTIHEGDVAAVSVRALTDAAHAQQTYLLTGPQSLTQTAKVEVIGRTIGRELSFVELPPEQVRQGMLQAGLPEEIPDRLLGSLADYAHQAGPSSDTVERVLGRPALSYATWVAEHVDAFTN
jgi:uncharacterized protein YbjT (DUF2867 family)